MKKIKSLCVFCGSNFGANGNYRDAASMLGMSLAQRGIQLVYGGSNVGLMGEIATAALSKGGEVIGVLPQALSDLELAHQGLSQLHIVQNMHERKQKMADLADGFIMLPGGIGTLEEFFEVWGWLQLGFHEKPLGLLNIDGYYDDLLKFMQKSVAENFVMSEHNELALVAEQPDELVEKLLQVEYKFTSKIVDLAERDER